MTAIAQHLIQQEQISNTLKGRFMVVDSSIPAFKHKEGDAGYDLYAIESKWIFPWSVTKIKTNTAIEIPVGYYARVTGRSGETSAGNVVHDGTVDSNYRGIVHIMMSRVGVLPRKIKKGTRVAQLIITPYCEMEWEKAKRLSESNRGTDSFGSSGIK